MYKSFRVQNFRGFRDLQLDDLARVNLIAGKNNTGKTALLEAILTYCGEYDASLLLRITDAIRRSYRSYRLENGVDTVDPGWSALFHNFETNVGIQLFGRNAECLESETDQNSADPPHLTIALAEIGSFPPEISLQQRVRENVVDANGCVLVFMDAYESWMSFNPFSFRPRDSSTTLIGEKSKVERTTKHKSFFLPTNKLLSAEDEASLFTEIRRTRQDKRLLDLARKFDTRLLQLEVLKNGPYFEIHGHLDDLEQPLPISSMGEGMRRSASLLLAIAKTENGIVLVDEIETGLHHSVQVEVWRAIAEAARAYNVQIFATTHSYEMISAAHEAHKEVKPFDFRLYGLRHRRESNEIRAVSYDEETLDAAVEMYLEMR